MNWRTCLRGDPLPWLLEPDDPPVRYFTLRDLLEHPDDDLEVVRAKAAITSYAPVCAILDAQYPDGYWVKPGPGYSPKYRSTVWQIIFLEQMGADGADPRVKRGCEHALEHTQAESGGFGASGSAKLGRPPLDRVLHCLNGNLVRALAGFGYAADERLGRAVEWQARAITGSGNIRYYRSGTTGPGFACAWNGGQPCAWGAIKALRGLVRASASRPLGWSSDAEVSKAIRAGVDFLLSRDPVVADYPTGDGRVSSLWFKLGFPSGYVADVLQNLEVLTELGRHSDGKLGPAVEWLLRKQDARGRWRNRYAYNGKLWADVEQQGSPSKWVTLRALRVLKAVHE